MRPDCNRALRKENRKLRLLLLIREIEAGAREKITQAQMAEELGVTERYARELNGTRQSLGDYVKGFSVFCKETPYHRILRVKMVRSSSNWLLPVKSSTTLVSC